MYRSRSPVYKTEVAEGFEACVKEQIDQVMDPTLPPTPWAVTFWFYFPDKRRRDVDNNIKAGMDAVTRALGVDDSNVDEVHGYKRYDKANPRCEVVVTTVNHDE
jgi:Holliday junction resolvase RusA-like endonuclease